MRELIFRAWDIKGNEMLNNIGVHPSICCIHDDYVKGDGGRFTISPQFTNYIIEQYTGLTDKNGVKIFEGDLLRIPAKNKYEETTYNCFEVFYHNNECIGGQNIGFCINRMHPQGNSGGGVGYKFTPESIARNGLVVFANIHENSELLEAK